MCSLTYILLTFVTVYVPQVIGQRTFYCRNLTDSKTYQMKNNSSIRYIHAIEEPVVSFAVPNLQNYDNRTISCVAYDETRRNNTEVRAQSSNSTHITCTLSISLESKMKKNMYNITCKAKNQNNSAIEIGVAAVILYNCSNLALDYTHCTNLISEYKCIWCQNTRKCKYKINDNCTEQTQQTPPPVIQVQPMDGINTGQPYITIYGTDLGLISDKKEITFGGAICESTNCSYASDCDYKQAVVDQIVCRLQPYFGSNSIVFVHLKVNELSSAQNQTPFTFKIPTFSDVYPRYGPLSGGTRITIFGSNLAIGNRNLIIQTTTGSKCDKLEIVDSSPGLNVTIQCDMPPYPKTTQSFIEVLMFYDTAHIVPKRNLSFSYLLDPVIANIPIKRGFLSGGTNITIFGTNLNHTLDAIHTTYFQDRELKQKCYRNFTDMTCTVPAAPPDLLATNNDTIKTFNQRVPVIDHECVDVNMTIQFDGILKSFNFTYCQDPEFSKFETVLELIGFQQHNITISGKYLNLSATKNDYVVTVQDDRCKVISLSDTSIVCQMRPLTGNYVELMPYDLNVSVGYIQVKVGSVVYIEALGSKILLALVIGGCLLAIVLIGSVFGYLKFRSVHKKQLSLETELTNVENEIIGIARQEFFDMNMCISTLNKKLVEKGFPYHGYWQFARNVIVLDYLDVDSGSSDRDIINERGFNGLELLFTNKLFVVSLISTLERQKSFFVAAKSLFASNLFAIMMGKMDYMKEIITVLLINLIKESVERKTQKSLFRWCETITENLLANWMILCIYPHLKNSSGSSLYLLYMAILTTMETGPIDAITDAAKYTLCEKTLLTKWCLYGADKSNDCEFTANPLTLRVTVQKSNDCFTCKVLDCDTISQVKQKCLHQIYLNYPASRLQFDPQDLILEWHEGFNGVFVLCDEDNSSLIDEQWLRLNTIRHYNVKNNSVVGLRHINDRFEDECENIVACNAYRKLDISSNELVTREDTAKLKRWHLVKPEENEANHEASITSELYLNRLFTTKKQISEILNGLFDVILSKENCPLHTRFLYALLDELGSEFQIDHDVIHAWKSHSYPIQVWATLMKSPSLILDVKLPSFIDVNLELISQVFIEFFSLTFNKCTKKTSIHKLLFHNEIQKYQEKVKQFFEGVRLSKASSDIQKYLTEVNELQATTKFNKKAVMEKLYLQMKPYLDEIINELQTNTETSHLQLDKQLHQVIQYIEAENVGNLE